MQTGPAQPHPSPSQPSEERTRPLSKAPCQPAHHRPVPGLEPPYVYYTMPRMDGRLALRSHLDPAWSHSGHTLITVLPSLGDSVDSDSQSFPSCPLRLVVQPGSRAGAVPCSRCLLRRTVGSSCVCPRGSARAGAGREGRPGAPVAGLVPQGVPGTCPGHPVGTRPHPSSPMSI